MGISRDHKSGFPASRLKFRHARKGCLHALLEARVGSLKLTLVEYSTPSHIAFIFSQWQLTGADCSTQLFTVWCQRGHNNFCLLSFAFPCFNLTRFPFFPPTHFLFSRLTSLVHSMVHQVYNMLFVLVFLFFHCCYSLQFSTRTGSTVALSIQQADSYDCFNNTVSFSEPSLFFFSSGLALLWK